MFSAENIYGTSFYQRFSDLVFPPFCPSCRISCFQSLLWWKWCHHLLKNTLVMLKTSDSQFGPVFMLFYAALFLLLHGTTAWSEVRQVKVYEPTSGPNWSQRDHRNQSGFYREGSWSPSFVCLYLHLTLGSRPQPVPGPAAVPFRSHLGWNPVQSWLWQPAVSRAAEVYHFRSSLTLLPFDAVFLFLQRSPFIGLLQSRSNTFFYLTVFWGVEFQFFNVCLMFLCGWIHINSWDSRQTSNQRFQSKYIQSWPFLSSVSEFRLTEAMTALLDWRESAFNLMFRSNGPPAPLWSCSLKLIVWL